MATTTMDRTQLKYDSLFAPLKRIRQAEQAGDSSIQRLYQGAVILITGGTGFLGKQLLEKLLRACPEIQKVYLLCRIKKGKSISDRLSEQFKDPVYNELRSRYPNFEKKVVAIQGDIDEIRLGIATEVWDRISGEIDFIYHAAATVRFNEPLKKTVITNVRGTREAIILARECPKLRVFVYVSTAYANCNKAESEERFYDSPVRPNTIIELVECMDEAKIDAMTPALIQGWPNTYTYSKLVAESVVRTMGQGLPICVVRPPIVTPTYHEPAPGWLDMSNIFGPSAILLGLGTGLIHALWLSVETKLDLVPLDFVNNCAIAASWETVNRWARGQSDIRIYNASRNRNKIGFMQMVTYMQDKVRYAYVTPRAVWYCFTTITANWYLFTFFSIFLHFIPGAMVDLVLAGVGHPLRLTRIYKKGFELNSVLGYFIFRDFIFHDDNTVDLFNKMSKTDKTIFNFEVTDIQFEEFFVGWILGVRKYIMKDNLEGTEAALAKQKYLRIVHYIVFALYLLFLWKVFSWIYFFVHFSYTYLTIYD